MYPLIGMVNPDFQATVAAPFEETSDGGLYKDESYYYEGEDSHYFEGKEIDWKKIMNLDSENSAEAIDGSDLGMMDGFMTSVGEQNSMDRDFNSAEAAKQRDWAEEMLKLQMDYNSAEASANREWQSNESKLSRDWQQMMSDTSYQRAVSDLRRAGLNPILAAQRMGASTGSGGMATGGSAASVAPVSGSSASSSGSRGVDLTQIVSAIGSFLSGAGNLIGQFLPSKIFSTVTKK